MWRKMKPPIYKYYQFRNVEIGHSNSSIIIIIIYLLTEKLHLQNIILINCVVNNSTIQIIA